MNQAIVALPVSARAVGRDPLRCSVSIANLDIARPIPTASSLVRGQVDLIDARQPQTLDPQRGPEVIVATCRRAGLGDRGYGSSTPGKDGGGLRWRSTTALGRGCHRTGCAACLLVGAGDPYLETACRTCPARSCTASRLPSTARTPTPSCST
jgi:hypothetical protein